MVRILGDLIDLITSYIHSEFKWPLCSLKTKNEAPTELIQVFSSFLKLFFCFANPTFFYIIMRKKVSKIIIKRITVIQIQEDKSSQHYLYFNFKSFKVWKDLWEIYSFLTSKRIWMINLDRALSLVSKYRISSYSFRPWIVSSLE